MAKQIFRTLRIIIWACLLFSPLSPLGPTQADAKPKKLKGTSLYHSNSGKKAASHKGIKRKKSSKGIHQIGYRLPKYAAIVMDADTGQVFHTDEADSLRHPASLTKMATLYLVFGALKTGRISWNTQMRVSPFASSQSPTKLGLRAGESISVRTAVLGLITKSANDAAVVVAEYLAGSEEAFARQMTLKARALGMNSTIFKNASGLPNPAQITTARDLAKLSQALYRDFPKEYKLFATQSFTHRGVAHRNHNHLLGKVPGVDGIKTGLTNASGFNLAASAVRYDHESKPHRLITVVLGGPNRHWRDRRVTELLETHFVKYKAPSVTKYSSPENQLESVEEAYPDDQLNDLIYETQPNENDEVLNELHQQIPQSVPPSIPHPLKGSPVITAVVHKKTTSKSRSGHSKKHPKVEKKATPALHRPVIITKKKSRKKNDALNILLEEIDTQDNASIVPVKNKNNHKSNVQVRPASWVVPQPFEKKISVKKPEKKKYLTKSSSNK